MRITKELIEKLKEHDIELKIEVNKIINLDKLIGKNTNNLSEKDLINISKITSKTCYYWVNGHCYSIDSDDNENYAINIVDILKKLLDNAQSEINENMEQQFAEEDYFIKSDENDFIHSDDESFVYCEKELPEYEETKNSSYKKAVSDNFMPLYKDENGEINAHKKKINLYDVLGWESDEIHYVPKKFAFYKIMTNTLFKKDIYNNQDEFDIIDEKYSENLFEILKNSIKMDSLKNEELLEDDILLDDEELLDEEEWELCDKMEDKELLDNEEKDIPYVTIKGTDTPSFYIDENGKTKLYENLINLYDILGWKENEVYYVPNKLAFYKIKDNSLYQKDVNITIDKFDLINEKYSERLFETLKNAIKKEDYNHLKDLSDYIKSVKKIEPKTIEEVWNNLIQIEKKDNDLFWNYHYCSLEQRLKKEKNIIDYVQAIYLCAYGELKDDNLIVKFKDIQEPLKYNIEKDKITLMKYFLNNNIKEVKNYAKSIGRTEDEFNDLVSAIKELNEENIPKDYVPCDELKKIVNHFYDLYKDAIAYLSIAYDINYEYDEVLPLVDFIKKHKKEVSKELLEDAMLYEENNRKWCKKHKISYEC